MEKFTLAELQKLAAMCDQSALRNRNVGKTHPIEGMRDLPLQEADAMESLAKRIRKAANSTDRRIEIDRKEG